MQGWNPATGLAPLGGAPMDGTLGGAPYADPPSRAPLVGRPLPEQSRRPFRRTLHGCSP